MTKIKLLKILNGFDGEDLESEHMEADEALLLFINDKEITKAYKKIDKWYS